MSLVPRSISARLVLATLLLLPLALAVTGGYLERAHRAALDAATGEKLQLQVLALLAQADFSEEFSLPLLPLEPRLIQPNSGLYALVTDARDRPLWMSPSALLLEDPIQTIAAGVPLLAPGQQFTTEGDGLLRHAYQVLWESGEGDTLPLRFLVAESTEAREAELGVYRKNLWLWLGATLALLLAVQLLIFRWGLLPLRRLARDIEQIEAGESSDLPGPWPREVQPLADSLQALLHGEQQRRTRMRNTLSDLAHSLKTPLAVLRSADPATGDYAALQAEQLDRMEEVVGWHLQRASGGNHRLLQRVAVAPALDRLRNTLLKVYAERDLQFTIDCPDSACFRGDERDLLELLGNILDNACKYAKRRVGVTVRGGSDAKPMELCVEDDGEGVSPELRDTLLQRGARADTRREGQGIGLAVVLEIVAAHSGTISLEDSMLGGATVRVLLP